MRFAKLFEFEEEGQLLVLVQQSLARENVDAPYQLILETMGRYGRSRVLIYPYADERARDAEFARFDAADAAHYFRWMQDRLLQDFINHH